MENHLENECLPDLNLEIHKESKAAALKYNFGMNAPRLVAFGKGKQASRITSLANEHGLPISKNHGWALEILEQVPVGANIPPLLYEAMAKVLAIVVRENLE